MLGFLAPWRILAVLAPRKHDESGEWREMRRDEERHNLYLFFLFRSPTRSPHDIEGFSFRQVVYTRTLVLCFLPTPTLSDGIVAGFGNDLASYKHRYRYRYRYTKTPYALWSGRQRIILLLCFRLPDTLINYHTEYSVLCTRSFFPRAPGVCRAFIPAGKPRARPHPECEG